MGIIYQATNKLNGKVYIGKTNKTLPKRIKIHNYDAFRINNKRSNTYFYKAIRKYGAENFIWEEIEEINNDQDLNEKEIYWIKIKKSMDKKYGYNTHIGGTGGVQTNPEVLKKMLGRKHTEEEKNKISKSLKGKKQTKEAIEKRAASLKGRKRTNQEMEGFIESRKKKILCLETKIIYNSVTEASKKTGISLKRISANATGRTKTAGGYHWIYV